MKTIAIIGQKGGTGKTNLATILLVAFENDGKLSLGVDLDPQASLCKWADRRHADTPAILPMVARRLPHALTVAAAQGVDVVIIDTAGRAKEEALSAVKVADLVIIPLQPTTDDLETFAATRDYLKFGSAPALVVLVMVESRGTLHEQATRFLENMGAEVCPCMMGRRVAHRHASTAGLVPAEYEQGGKAAAECERIHAYIRQKLEGLES